MKLCCVALLSCCVVFLVFSLVELSCTCKAKFFVPDTALGRSWLYTALNEQSMESYVRIFAENQDFVQEFYLR